MKNHYLLTQLADVLLQLYENGIKGYKDNKEDAGENIRGAAGMPQETILDGRRVKIRKNADKKRGFLGINKREKVVMHGKSIKDMHK